jgi:transcriptional regulator with XRE-family HTH domain
MDVAQNETFDQRRELRDFLQARRAALKPEDVGLQGTGRRRAPGLRREEVASLACVGLTWYTWLEQGRDIHVSEEMLQRVARALKLSPHDTAYLFSLAGRRPPEICASEKRSILPFSLCWTDLRPDLPG